MLNRLIILIAVAGIFNACTVNEPSLPTWDSQWAIEFPAENMTMEDIVNDSTVVTGYDPITGDSIIVISISDSTEHEQIDSADMGFGPDDEHYSESLGSISLDAPPVEQTGNVSFSELFAYLNLSPGDNVQIDPVTLEPAPQYIVMDDYNYVVIDSAELQIKVYNGLIVDIESGMKITIFDDTRSAEPDGGLIDTVYFSNPVPANSMGESDILNLAGKYMSNELRLEYSIPIAGTVGAITITQQDLDSYYYTEVLISDMKVSSAEAMVPSQEISERDSVGLNLDGDVAYMATVDKGILYANLQNNLPVGLDIELILPNFVDQLNNPKKVIESLPAGSQSNISLDLSDLRFQNDKNPGQPIEYVIYDINAISMESNGYVQIASDDSVTVDFTSDSIYFSYFEGKIQPIIVDIEPVEENDLLDVANVDGNITLDKLTLTIDAFNEINYDISLELDITGYHKAADTKTITDSVKIHINEIVGRGGGSGNPAITSIIIDSESTTPSIVDLMEILPTDIIVSGRAVIQGDGSVFKDDEFWVNYYIDSPLSVRLDNSILYKGDIEIISNDDLDQDQRDDIDKYFTNVDAQLRLDNGLPLAANVRLFIATDTTDFYSDVITDSSRKVIISSSADPGVTGQNGYVITRVETTNKIKLSERQIDIFQYDPIYVGTLVEILPTESEVSFRKDDELTVGGALYIDVLIDPED